MTKFEQDMTTGMATLNANVNILVGDVAELKKSGCAQGRVDRTRIDALEAGGKERWGEINRVKGILMKRGDSGEEQQTQEVDIGHGIIKTRNLPVRSIIEVIFALTVAVVGVLVVMHQLGMKEEMAGLKKLVLSQLGGDAP